ncbi:hypothetical protein CALVIDRAFT_525185 [Calocera viscosa TUFC12733]|uniref:Uncharacterized protein n=1 Tax=Calocera viscosa (strain TUFC12733) TaxID=1330018 RepID=A0A167QAU7_CALVF|nr:hypothetical protein CALVIDRAFT_525185 [Calocera viscosa TUFC12733]
MYIWTDLNHSFAPPFGDRIPFKEQTRTKNGVTTTVDVLDYYAIVTIIVDLQKLLHWYDNQGGRERLRALVSAEDEAEMKMDDANLGVLPDSTKRTTEERIMARVNKVLKPAGKGFVWVFTAHIEDFEFVHEYMCVWTLCVGTPPLRAFTQKITPEERTDLFYNRADVSRKLERLSTLFGEEFLEAVNPSVLVDRQDECLPWLLTTGRGEIAAARKAEKK